MASKKRTVGEIERDRAEISEMYLKGYSHYKIAEIINKGYEAQGMSISRRQISYDIEVINKSWKDAQIENMGELKRIELAKIDQLERVYWEAWELSCQERIIETTKLKGLADLKGNVTKQIPVEKTQSTTSPIGNPSFLAGVQWCIMRRCELLGLDAPSLISMSVCQAVGFDVDEV